VRQGIGDFSVGALPGAFETGMSDDWDRNGHFGAEIADFRKIKECSRGIGSWRQVT